MTMVFARNFWLCAFVLAFVLLSSLFMGIWDDFVLDDAFITYRYAANWVEYGTILWNPGSSPVEGYTSFMWVLLNAGGIYLGMDPVAVSRSVSVLAVIAVMYWLWRETLGLTSKWRAVIVGAIGLSAPMALHASQGMETAFAAAVVFALVIVAERAGRNPRGRYFVEFFLFSLVAALCRPELVLLSGITFLVLVAVLTSKGNTAVIRRGLIIATPFVILGSVYFLSRAYYFGSVFPNTFYVKQQWNLSAVHTVWSFIVTILGAYLAIIFFVLSRSSSGSERWASLLAPTAGIVGLLAYFTTISHIQGFVYRFPVVVYPGVVYLFARALITEEVGRSGGGVTRIALVGRGLLVSFLLAWPLTTLPEALKEIRGRQQDDRVAVGKALSDLNGRMFVTEAGALPYFSGWKAVDWLGLNDRTIAREGLSAAYLKKFEPDLIMILVDPVLNPARLSGAGWKYIREEFFMASAIVKRGYEDSRRVPGQSHVYFVRKSSSICEDIVERLSAVEAERVKYTETILAPVPGIARESSCN